jgi:hypothetical protein
VPERYGNESKSAEHTLQKRQLNLDAVFLDMGRFILPEKTSLILQQTG